MPARNVMRLMTIVLAGTTIFTQAAFAQGGGVDSGALLEKYCTKCHNTTDWAGGIDLEGASAATLADTPQDGEKLIKRLRAGMMPPVGEERPEYDTVQKLAQSEEQGIDKRAATHGAHLPAPGQPTPFAICWRSTSMPPDSCPPTIPVTASTTWRAL